MDRKNSKARINANNRYNAKTYDQIRYNYRKDERLNDLIDYAANKAGISKASYIIQAVKDKLTADGVTVDMLPPIKE